MSLLSKGSLADSGGTLEGTARKVRDLLLIYVRESKIVDHLRTSLLQAVLESGDDAATPSQELLNFEVVCFLTVLLMTVEIPRVHADDVDQIHAFNRFFVPMINDVVPRLDEPEIGSVSFGARMQEYGQLSSSVEAAEHFVKTVALGSGTSGYALREIVAMRFVEPLVDMSRMVVARMFA